jgi:hypothetical protein
MISAAHRAIGAGLTSTACQLVNTACITLARRSSSSGMATTLEANMGAAMTPPMASQSSNR